MPRRRYRLFMVCAAVILFMLYRVVLNSWDEESAYANLPFSGHGGSKPVAHDDPSLGNVNASPLDHDQLSPEKESPVEEEKLEAAVQPPAPERPLPHVSEADDDTTAGSGTQDKTTPHDVISPDDVVGLPEDSSEPLTWKNPPKEISVEKAQDGDPKAKKHWKKIPEKFPVADGEIIPIPSGTPKKIPTIQYKFAAEPEAAKTKRLERQKRVKEELTRAWQGYRKFAWMHDELMPVSGKFKDPFCGWAATLVDSLDTLWIAGMKTEFDEAAKAVADIDFTTSPQSQIPVFETTIRYLGGLLAAYDVSGGHEGSYRVLLDKAIELAEILMGIFDTPNRMPQLYYRWAPEFASQPHRAGRVGIAEFGTLSMEFTRLAQLTGKSKYYDAVDRITDALIQLQEDGTTIPGLFPENLDASGCNRTATTIQQNLSKAAQKQLEEGESFDDAEGFSVALDGQRETEALDNLRRRDDTSTTPVDVVAVNEVQQPPLKANGLTSDWDCVPQPLVSNQYGIESYHMGGGQDSAYEYFPKQYLLLGGLVPKYQKLHEDTIAAIHEWLLFRPMAKDDWDVLFPAKVKTSGDPQTDLVPTFEITHLTCFIGGMFALGGKIFGRDEDIETAKQLTDGCVWAYQLTPSGLMPEGSEVIPCPSLEKCDFNETLWYESLDPAKEWRANEINKWEQRQKFLDENDGQDSNELRGEGSGSIKKRVEVSVEDGESKIPQSLKDKLGLNEDGSAIEGAAGDETPTKTVDEKPPSIPKQKNTHKLTKVEAAKPQPKPQSHEEYIAERLASENLPPGFTNVGARHYILRPEAIESVWYMYRITGDPTWMDKGWAMFEATSRATRTEFANSAIMDVLDDEPSLKDEMESFWIAETLKYYYLLFSEPDVISLDEWVLNTEAHPFKRPV